MASWANLYRIEESLVREIVDSPQKIEDIIEGNLNDAGKLLSENDFPTDRNPAKYSFDRWEKWERFVLILGECETRLFYDLFNYQAKHINYDGYNTHYYSPLIVREIADELNGVSFKEIQEAGLNKSLATYDGRVFTTFDYQYVIGDIKDIQSFFHTAAERQQYVLFIAGGF